MWRYVCVHLPRDRQETEDVVSETFLAAIRTVRAFDPDQGTVYHADVVTAEKLHALEGDD